MRSTHEVGVGREQWQARQRLITTSMDREVVVSGQARARAALARPPSRPTFEEMEFIAVEDPRVARPRFVKVKVKAATACWWSRIVVFLSAWSRHL